MMPSSAEARAAVYRPQGAAYSRALQRALDLPTPPPFELWFVAARVIHSVRM